MLIIVFDLKENYVTGLCHVLQELIDVIFSRPSQMLDNLHRSRPLEVFINDLGNHLVRTADGRPRAPD
jgi:hypothetical protein